EARRKRAGAREVNVMHVRTLDQESPRTAQGAEQTEVRGHEGVRLLVEMKDRRGQGVGVEERGTLEHAASGLCADPSVQADQGLDVWIAHGQEKSGARPEAVRDDGQSIAWRLAGLDLAPRLRTLVRLPVG